MQTKPRISELPTPTKEVCDYLIEYSQNKPAGEKYSYMEVAMLITGFAPPIQSGLSGEEWLREQEEMPFTDDRNVTEKARLYAESKMNPSWDRRDEVLVSTFYTHFIKSMMQQMSVLAASTATQQQGERVRELIDEEVSKVSGSLAIKDARIKELEDLLLDILQSAKVKNPNPLAEDTMERLKQLLTTK
jgi:hypothetical protein